MLISSIQQSDLVIFINICIYILFHILYLYVYMYILFHIHFHSGLSQDVEYSSLCSAVVACCLPSSLDSFKCLRPL